MNTTIAVFAFLAALAAAACSSPIDLDTPRDDYFSPAEFTWLPARTTVLALNGSIRGTYTYNTVVREAGVDTSGGKLALRLDAQFSAPAGPLQADIVYIDTLDLAFAALDLRTPDGEPVALGHDPSGGVTIRARMKLQSGRPGFETIHPDGTRNNELLLDVQHYPQQGSLEIFVDVDVRGQTPQLSGGWSTQGAILISY